MYYMMYLTNLCDRRHWAAPEFETRRNRNGWTCRVRVNHREYSADTTHETEELARDKAAEAAYMICRNFSLNDGMIPGQRQGQAGVTQGLPIAIGTGRRSSRTAVTTAEIPATVQVQNAYGYPSGSSSPHSSEGDSDTTSRRSSGPPAAVVCQCRRAYVYMHQHCQYCLQEAGYRWA